MATHLCSALPPYAELHCLSNFSFHRGASSTRELFDRAKTLGYHALAITDECSLAGIVRAWQASIDTGIRLVIGTEIRIEDGPKIVLLAENLTGYQNICQLITTGRRNAKKGSYRVTFGDLDLQDSNGLVGLWIPDAEYSNLHGCRLKEWLPDRLWIAAELHCGPDDRAKLTQLQSLAVETGIPIVAAGDVHMHVRGRRALQDTLTAIRHHCTVATAGFLLYPNGERHLRKRSELCERYPIDLLRETIKVADLCQFTLDKIQYRYPRELVPAGYTPASYLRAMTEEGVLRRWPGGIPVKARKQIESELALIDELGYDAYFLTVHDIVRFARERHILCQGRGSAANSAVCFALGITELDPSHTNLLFERFISRERNEPPDIDVDFEHERREEVIQYIYQRYGRDRAALTAVATTYHYAGAVRDVAKALELEPDLVDKLAKCGGRSDGIPSPEMLREAGFDPDNRIIHMILVLTESLIGFPRHLSQHPGGFVISDAPLSTLVPVENAAMVDRTIIQWDKDDLDALNLLKVDVLALGMLSAIRRTLDMLRRYNRGDLSLATIPAEDPDTYRMISAADTIGVFQIESRAQQSMLPRLKPKTFYDLVIEVAIVRPGPIVGQMVHPYLRRRNGDEPVDYPSDELREVFERTLGVPLFQEQVMKLAIVAAGYTPGEADQLRRSMAAWKRHGGLEPHQERLKAGMLERGYPAEFADQVFEQIKGFGSYGFPESHAASFALLTYASCWLKCHEPAAFTASLINSWPMGFYTPDQLLQDARRHGIETLAVDVNHSDWDCTLDDRGTFQPAIRLGLRMIKGLSEEVGRRIEQNRNVSPFRDVADLCHRSALDNRVRGLLADAGALATLVGDRHQSRWAIAGVEPETALFASASEAQVALPIPSVTENMLFDYQSVGTTLGPHPMALLREQLSRSRCRSSKDLLEVQHGRPVVVAGIVTGRQRPSTASGVTFVTLEDEFGMINVIVWRDLAERQRSVLRGASILQVKGRFEEKDGVRHVIAGWLGDIGNLLAEIDVPSRNYR